ncbi:MAG: AMP-binding protein, partial [Gemmatimonadota bacterium]|nr:AMP-binding protein [Gemmatimonadota bacterium]
TVRQDLREIGPQVIFSPPRIWESIVSEVQVMIEDTTPLKRRLFDWAMGLRRMGAVAGAPEQSSMMQAKTRIADWAVFLPLRDQLGLKNIRRAYTGGAALGPDVFRFFHAIGVNLKQLYGQTEVAGISVVHRDDDIRFHTVGRPLPGTEVKIAPDGEILCKGPSVFGGYFENEEATAEALEDGWLHSGDAGYIDEHGHLVVIDRLNDVTKLHDGTTFSPQFVENKLKFSPYVKEAVSFGGGDLPFVTAIVAIDFENAGQWAEKRRIAYTTFTDLARKPDLYALIHEHVREVNRALPEAARVQRFLLLHKELHADDAELTRTRKVRRDFIRSRFEDLVAGLYSEDDSIRVQTEITYQDGRTATVAHDLRIERVTATVQGD